MECLGSPSHPHSGVHQMPNQAQASCMQSTCSVPSGTLTPVFNFDKRLLRSYVIVLVSCLLGIRKDVPIGKINIKKNLILQDLWGTREIVQQVKHYLPCIWTTWVQFLKPQVTLETLARSDPRTQTGMTPEHCWVWFKCFPPSKTKVTI